MRDPLLCHKDLRREHIDGLTLYLSPGVEPDEVLGALRDPGEPLKESTKSSVRRFGNWVIKESAAGALNTVKRTARRARYRQAWIASHHLDLHGVNVPAPVAFVERRSAGIIRSNAMISEYLDEHRDVEDFTRGILQRGAGRDTLEHFFGALATAVNQLEIAGARHADLSGKNIYTRDGARFTFIDLDAVELGGPLTGAQRLKAHVQLYDSFCDHLPDRLLVPFISQLLPEDIDPRTWVPKVRAGQAKRRQILNARRAKAGG